MILIHWERDRIRTSFHMFTFNTNRMPKIITPFTNKSSAKIAGEHRTRSPTNRT